MGKKKGKRVDPEKKAALQAKKEAKADKAAQKRLNKQARNSGAADDEAASDTAALDALLQQYKAHDRQALQSTQVETLQGFPLARANATLTLYEDKKQKELYLFGGEYYDGVENIVLDHLLSYNVTKQEWKRLHTVQSPPPRCAHSTVYYNHALYVFGGERATADQYHHYKDVWRFDLKELTWQEFTPTKAVGTHPTARSGHTAVVWKHYMVVFGGFYETADHAPRWYHDVCVLDLQTHQWLAIPHSKLAVRPEPRSACNAAILQDDLLVIHGGFSKLSAKPNSQPPPTTTKAGSDSTVVVVVASETKVHNDAWVLRLKPLLSGKTPTWERLTSSVQRQSLDTSKSPNGRAGTSSVAFKDRLLAFGGVMDVENYHHKVNSVFYADLFAFDVERRKWFPVHVQQSSSGQTSKRRRRKVAESATLTDEAGNEENEEESDNDDEEVKLEEEEGEEDNAKKDNGWDLEKLRSNMFAFIDGEGNVVYERIGDSDNEEEEDGGRDEEEEVVEEKEETREEGKADAKRVGKQQVNTKQNKYPRTPAAAAATNPDDQQQVVSASSVMVLNPETNRPEAVSRSQPLPRINSKLVVSGNTLYIYGGLLEVGDREVTLDDLWCVDLRKRSQWNCLWPGTMHKQVWRGAVFDDDDSYYSNNSGPAADEDGDDEKEEEKSEHKEETKEETKEDEVKNDKASKSRRSELRSRMKEIVQQYDMSDERRTPQPGESLTDFYARTGDVWNGLAAEKVGEDRSSKETKRQGFGLAQQRFEELGPAMKELGELDELYKEASADKKAKKK